MKILCLIFQLILFISHLMSMLKGKKAQQNKTVLKSPLSSTVCVVVSLSPVPSLSHRKWGTLKETLMKTKSVSYPSFITRSTRKKFIVLSFLVCGLSLCPLRSYVTEVINLCTCAKILNTEDHSVGAVRVKSRLFLVYSLSPKYTLFLFFSQQFPS